MGTGVTKVKAGDHVGVGCMVDSCRQCLMCDRGEEQFCHKRKLCIIGNYSTAFGSLAHSHWLILSSSCAMYR